MLDFSYENILHSNIINFTVMIAFFAFLIAKLKLGEKISSARHAVKEKIETSDGLKVEAEDNFKRVLKSVENLPAEIKSILEDAKKTVSGLKEKVRGEIEEAKASLEANAEKIIGAEISGANNDVKKEMSAKSVEKAREKLKQALGADSTLHRKFIENSISELEGLNI